VTDSVSDPPQTLADAELKFSTFLAAQSYPKKIRWLVPTDVLVDNQRRFWIRERGTNAAMHHAALRYSEGVERRSGIELRAICSTETQTFAFVFVPKDDLDAQYHLMGHALKLTCPTEKYPTSRTKNPVKWLALWLRNGRRSKMLEV
jgi:hypothetical protein